MEKAESLGRQSVRGGMTTLVAQGAKFAIRLLSQIAIARYLLPADYGLVAMVAPVLALVQLVAEMGLGQATVQQRDISGRDVSTLFWFGLVVNTAMALVVVAASPLISAAYGEPRLVRIAIALAVLIPVAGLATQPKALLNRDLKLSSLAVMDVLPSGLNLALSFAAAYQGFGYWSLVIGTVVETVITVALCLSMSPWRPSFTMDLRKAWSLIRVGGNVTAFNLAQYATTTADNILLAALQGPSALGLYDKAYKTVTLPLGQLFTPFNRVAIPALVRLSDTPDRYRRAFFNMLEIAVVAGTPSVLFVMCRSKPVMHILLGSAWDGVAPVMSWLCFGCLASPIYSSTAWLFLSQQRSGQQLRFAMLTSLISVVSFAIGIPWGPAGVAAGAGLSFLLIATPLTCWGATLVGPVTGARFVRSMLPLASASTGTGVALALLSAREPDPAIVRLLVEAGMSYAAFLILLSCFPGGRRLMAVLWGLKGSLFAAGGSGAVVRERML